MPLTNKKIISILLEQCAELDQRCEGYREEVIEVISEILAYERSHRVSATNIQKKIDDKFGATARFLAEQRGYDVDAEELQK